MPDIFLNANQAAIRLGVHEKTLRRWIDEGRVKATHVKKNRLAIAVSEIERLEQERALLAEIQRGHVPPVETEIAALTERVKELEQELTDYRISSSQGATPDFGDINHLENRLDAFEKRLSALEHLVQDMIAASPKLPTIVTKQVSRWEEPDDVVTLADFAKLHTIPERTSQRHAKQIGASKGPGRMWYLDTPSSKAAFYEQFHTHEKFKACDRCPHETS